MHRWMLHVSTGMALVFWLGGCNGTHPKSMQGRYDGAPPVDTTGMTEAEATLAQNHADTAARKAEWLDQYRRKERIGRGIPPGH